MSFLKEYSNILEEANSKLKREIDDSYLESLRLKAENARLKNENTELLQLNTQTIQQYATQIKLYEAKILTLQQLLNVKRSDPE
jgi:hypothetical protein